MRGRELLLGGSTLASYFVTNGASVTSGAVNAAGAVDSSGNIYTSFSKRDTQGGVTWQYTQTNDTLVAVDSTGASYTVSSVSGTYTTIRVLKISTSGSLVWARTLSATTTNLSLHSCCVDSADNLIVAHTRGTSAGLTKISSAGSVTWSVLMPQGNTTISYDITTDSANNIYITYSASCSIYKLTSAGVITWGRFISVPSNTEARGVAVASNGDVYIAVGGNGMAVSANQVMGLVKLDSSGTFQWRSAVGYSGSSVSARDVAISPDGSIYLIGQGISSRGVVMKYNSSGTLQWLREIYGSVGASLYRAFATDSGITVVTSAGYIWRIPPDGSLTKTVGTFTYATNATYASVTPPTITMGTDPSSATAQTTSSNTTTFTLTNNTTTYTVYPL